MPTAGEKVSFGSVFFALKENEPGCRAWTRRFWFSLFWFKYLGHGFGEGGGRCPDYQLFLVCRASDEERFDLFL